LDIAIFEACRTSRSLAEELKVHESQLSRWRSGLHTPEPETQERIAKALGRTADELWPERAAA
jgi:transcriptional regulator with XRE-family HTH domain